MPQTAAIGLRVIILPVWQTASSLVCKDCTLHSTESVYNIPINVDSLSKEMTPKKNTYHVDRQGAKIKREPPVYGQSRCSLMLENGVCTQWGNGLPKKKWKF